MKRARGPRGPAQAPPGRVRIVGGRLRGSKLGVPVSPGLRPTPQRIRETLFNWLAPVIDGARVLDVFAGSGTLGVEALSRGASQVLLIENNRAQAAAIAADLARLRQPGGEVRCADALDFLAAAPAAAFDIAFLDPPFDTQLWAPAAALLEAHGWLAPGAFIYLEFPAAAGFEPPAAWTLHRRTRAGAVHAALYRRGQR